MNIFSKEEVKEATLRYFEGDTLATDVWIKKYCLKDSKGNLLEKTPDDMHRRLAKEFARIESKYSNPLSEQEIYELLKDFKYIVPQGSPMYGIGNNYSITSLSNCFVIGSNDQADSYGSIMRSDEEQVQLMKRRGGVGQDMSHLRPSGALANNAVLGGDTGMTLYMERYSSSTREVAQDGRRGALMLSTTIKHPDADRFIDAKIDTGKVTGANISVRITDAFMKAVEVNGDYIQSFPVNLDITLDSGIHAQDLKYGKLTKGALGYYKKVKARDLWIKIIKNAWQSAEPGVLFWDTIRKESPAKGYGSEWEEVSTNPCGEIPLNPYDSCRLIAINLYSYVENPFTDKAVFNAPLFEKHARIAQRLMDDLVDLEIEKIDKQLAKIAADPESEDLKRVERELWEKIREKAVQGRRTGLGVTAEGDMLAALGLRYGSPKAIDFAVNVHMALAVNSYISSIDMAEERGAFPIWDYEKDNSDFIQRIYKAITAISPDHAMKWRFKGRRNIANLTIAPTGTVSLMTQTTSGVEPLFMAYHKRRTKVNDKSKATFIDEVGDGWIEYFVMHPKFIKWFEVNYWDKSNDHLGVSSPKEWLENCHESILEKYFKESPYYKATANDVDWKASVTMQGAIQKWVDHSISKTVNVPESTTVEQVDEIYREAYNTGCKGCTIYRDGSRSGVLVSIKEEKTDKFEYSKAFKRPKVTECDIYHKTALKESWMVLVGKVDGNPYEIFAIKDVESHVFPKNIEKGTITKIKSKTYRLDGISQGKHHSIENIILLMSEDERVSTRKYSSMLRHGMAPKFIREQIQEFATIVSFDKVVERVLGNYIKEHEDKPKCPECGGSNYHAVDGCFKCEDCGYAHCG